MRVCVFRGRTVSSLSSIFFVVVARQLVSKPLGVNGVLMVGLGAIEFMSNIIMRGGEVTTFGVCRPQYTMMFTMLHTTIKCLEWY